MLNFKSGFNSFLESGDRQKELRLGYTGILLTALVGSSSLQFAISTAAALAANDNSMAAIPMSLLNLFFSLVISNVSFSFFCFDNDSGSIRLSARCHWNRLVRSIPIQIVCAAAISLVQVFASSFIVSMALMVSVQIGMFCSVFISVLASLVTAGCVFGIIEADSSEVNGVRGIKASGRILGRSLSSLKSGVGGIARPLVLLLAWNTLAAFAIPSVIAGFIGKSSALSSVSIASFIDSGMFMAAGIYTILMLIHFVVASYFEIDVLIGISARYCGKE